MKQITVIITKTVETDQEAKTFLDIVKTRLADKQDLQVKAICTEQIESEI